MFKKDSQKKFQKKFQSEMKLISKLPEKLLELTAKLEASPVYQNIRQSIDIVQDNRMQDSKEPFIELVDLTLTFRKLNNKEDIDYLDVGKMQNLVETKNSLSVQNEYMFDEYSILGNDYSQYFEDVIRVKNNLDEKERKTISHEHFVYKQAISFLDSILYANLDCDQLNILFELNKVMDFMQSPNYQITENDYEFLHIAKEISDVIEKAFLAHKESIMALQSDPAFNKAREISKDLSEYLKGNHTKKEKEDKQNKATEEAGKEAWQKIHKEMDKNYNIIEYVRKSIEQISTKINQQPEGMEKPEEVFPHNMPLRRAKNAENMIVLSYKEKEQSKLTGYLADDVGDQIQKNRKNKPITKEMLEKMLFPEGREEAIKYIESKKPVEKNIRSGLRALLAAFKSK